ncbi:BH3648 [Halalkalibacterium halodurans C-125]|uniref:BH3648 protein n=1 Tax=Halalkalibacterium halodurans (strain ATCC BAA-125 / DSM 18197 / FERM 7344 / JCM 9153 / C-125) TaxID=272558 RepID=Q9K6S8_HALH5|nr:peptidoglycan-binding protein [Halalkalibacterium halodurans]BAB07367.1 BH3648 [Halalkalibacterium halodurans C-125]
MAKKRHTVLSGMTATMMVLSPVAPTYAQAIDLTEVKQEEFETLKLGVDHQNVLVLKQVLYSLEYLESDDPESFTTYFDPDLEQVIVDLQEMFQFEPSGEVTFDFFELLVQLANEEQDEDEQKSTDVAEEEKNEEVSLAEEDLEREENETKLNETKLNETAETFSAMSTFSLDSTADSSVLFQVGDRDPEIITIKLHLEILGFKVSNNPTSYYGIQTEEMVRAFQSQYQLPVTGKVDQETRNLLSQRATGPLRLGMYREDVIQLKINLEKVGFPVSSNPNTYFGPTTDRQVRAFQQSQGLTADGIVGSSTIKALEEALSGVLFLGVRDSKVIDLKKMLADLGYGVSDNPTTYFGPVTEEQVKRFQNDFGRPVTGVVDRATFEFIQKMVEEGFVLRSGMNHPEVLKLKEYLAILGYRVSNTPNDFFGSVTEAKVREYQYDNGLQQTGIVTKQLLTELEKQATGPLKMGMYREDAITLKEQLAALGYVISNNPTNYYGPSTEATVKQFQKDHGLQVNGIADSLTLKKIQELLNQTLYFGVRNDKVVELKLELERLGLSVSSSPTTYFGSVTEEMVREFKRRANLPVTGVVNDEQLKFMKDIVYMEGMRASGIITLKEHLAILGFRVSDNPTTLYGAVTTEQVRQFQQKYGLSSTGIADQKTVDQLRALATRPLQLGMYHPDVVQLKKDLAKAGYFVSNNPNDYFGPTTTTKLKEFQTDHNLPATGIADRQTLNKIKEVVQAIGVQYVFQGKRQFGHGVGMTQWGAYGMSQQGFTYRQILTYYYTDVTVSSSSSYRNTNVRVMIGDEQINSATFSSTGTYSVQNISTGQFLFTNVTGNTTVTYGSGGDGTFRITNGGTTRTTQSEVRIVPNNSATIRYVGNNKNQVGQYYRGALHLTKSRINNLQSNFVMDVINHVDIDTYLEGVVPYEMIPSWAQLNAFKAQAVAARTYAFRNRVPTRHFDMYDDTRSQVYHGVPQGDRNNALVNQAIHETSGEVILHNNSLIDAVYSASASGHTVDARDVWGNDIAYLKGKRDPYDNSQYTQVSWTGTFTLDDLSNISEFKNRGLGKVVDLKIEARSERIISAQVIFERGSVTYSGSAFASHIGAPSRIMTYTIK